MNIRVEIHETVDGWIHVGRADRCRGTGALACNGRAICIHISDAKTHRILVDRTAAIGDLDRDRVRSRCEYWWDGFCK